MFITFEGLDFCGKSTQIKLLSEKLKNSKKEIIIIREPGGTNISEKVREILLDNKNSQMFIETELLLFSASRSQLVRQIILPELIKGNYVLSDRFHDSTTAYQGYGRGISQIFIRSLNKFVIENALPDITFFIDIPVEEVLKRKSKLKHIQLDRIEQSDRNFYKKVRMGYLELTNSEERFRMIDGTQPIEVIQSQILEEVKKHDK